MRRPVVTATAAVLGAIVLAACGGSSNTADHTGGKVRTVTVTEPGTSSTPSTTATGPLTDTTATGTTTTHKISGAACNASDLTPSYLGSNGAAGTIVLGFALKNTGTASCHTYGWPGVEFLSGSGKSLPTNATRTTGDVVGSSPATTLTLGPGDEASFRIVTSDMGPGGGACPTAAALQIIPPDDSATVKVTVPGIAACGKATVSPLMPGETALSGEGGGQTGVGSGGSGSGGAGSGGSGSGGSGSGGSGSGGSGNGASGI